MLRKSTTEKLDRLLDIATVGLQRQFMPSLAAPMPMSTGVLRVFEPRAFEPTPPSPEDIQLADNLMEELGPQIKRQAEALVKTRVKEMLLMGGNLARIKEILAKGLKLRIVRKREPARGDPLYLQWGDGVETEIEEIYLGI